MNPIHVPTHGFSTASLRRMSAARLARVAYQLRMDGREDERAFDACFEMGRGAAVAREYVRLCDEARVSVYPLTHDQADTLRDRTLFGESRVSQ